MREIPLTQGFVALVDDSDYELLSQHKWHAMKYKHTTYAVRGVNRKGEDGKRYSKRYWMHREILGLTDTSIQADHKDRNGLNNQRSNLRTCTQSQNNANRKAQRGKKYLGISFNKSRNKWRAQIYSNGKPYHLGEFINDIDAAKAYNTAALKLHGEFANLNQIHN